MNPSKQIKFPVNDLLDATSDAKAMLRAYAAGDFSGGGGSSIKPLYFNRFENEVPNVAVASGIDSYSPTYAFKLIGNISADSTTFAVTGGDTLSDAGTGSWAAVLEDVTTNRFWPVMVVSRSGSNVTILPPAPVAMTAAKLWHKHQGASGQHLSEAGNKGIADMLYFAPAYRFGYANAIARMSARDAKWTDLSPGFWKAYGGVSLANFEPSYNDNFSAGTFCFGESTQNCLAACSATGHGAIITIPIQYQSGIFSVGVGHSETDPTKTMKVELFADGISVGSETCYGYFKRVYIPFPKCSELECRVTSQAGAVTLAMRIYATEVYLNESQRPFLFPGESLLIIGDSWTNSSSYPGLTERLNELHDGTVTSVGVNGTAASYALEITGGKTRIQSWIDTYTPNVVLMHYYINDYNGSVTAANWETSIRAICQICIDNGVQPVVLLPGVTASLSQTQGMQTDYGNQFKAIRGPEVIGSALGTDISEKNSHINKFGKFPGRMVKNTTASEIYVASGAAQGDVWYELFDNTQYLIPKTFVGANVVLSQLTRAFVAETQSGATLDDSGSLNTNGTITNGTQLFDVADLRRGYVDYAADGYADLGATPALSATGAWTVAGWVKGSDFSSLRPMFTQAVAGDAGSIWLGLKENLAFLNIWAEGAHSTINLQPATVVTTGAWHHLAATRSGAVFKLYLDGVHIGTQTDADATRSLNQVGNLAGAWAYTTYNSAVLTIAGMKIADLIVDNVALSDADIAWLANDENYLI